MAATPSRLLSPLFFLRPFYEFIFPPVCLICETPMERTGSKVCATCWNSLRSVTPADPIYQLAHERLTVHGDLDGVASLWHFEKEGTLQSIVHLLKYESMTGLGVEMGRALGEKLLTEGVAGKYDAVIPVPLHRAKYRERGYNQSDFIGEGIQEVTGLSLLQSFLHRTRFTQSQTALDAVERKTNVRGAFSLAKGVEVRGRSFILVDDVITTGATIEACAVVLRENGAQNVFAASAALAG